MGFLRPQGPIYLSKSEKKSGFAGFLMLFQGVLCIFYK
jgi:hypothetical protein